MNLFTIYVASGEIIRTGRAPSLNIGLQASPGEFILVGASGNSLTQYIPDTDSPVVSDKLVNTTVIDKTAVTADGVDMVKITSIPINSSITLTNDLDSTVNQFMEVTESTLDVLFEIAGTYVLKIELFPFLTFEAVINAT